MWNDVVLGRTAGETTLEQGQSGSDMHGVLRSLREEGAEMSATAHVLP